MKNGKPFCQKLVSLSVSIALFSIFVLPPPIYSAEAATAVIIINPVNIASPLSPAQVIMLNREITEESVSLVTAGANGVSNIIAVSARD